MNVVVKALLVLVIAITGLHCSAQKRAAFKPSEVYKSDRLLVTQIAENSFVHTSFKQTNDFGNVPCNGLVVRNSSETIVFDTPTDDKGAEELIAWIKDSLRCTIKSVIPTHFHDDCLGGLAAFHAKNIPSHANVKTIELAKENGMTVPQNGFSDSLMLTFGNETIMATLHGEGHTKDNIVGYFQTENILFGGCLIKEMGASKGYLGDANLADWPTTVEKVKKAYPNVKWVIPGHGKYGNKRLLDYTIKLFSGK